MWTLISALAFVRQLEDACASRGWHVALGGGVMKSGASDHDVDVIAYPHCSQTSTISNLHAAMRQVGAERSASVERVQEHWRKKGSVDEKYVEAWWLDEQRIDLIVMQPDRYKGPQYRLGYADGDARAREDH